MTAQDNFEGLPADQQAVLSLLIRQGRSYKRVAGMLKIEPAAVRGRAHRALDALGGDPPRELTDDEAGEISDYVLGQLEEADRLSTLGLLLDDEVACAWARTLSERIRPLAKVPLPEVPDTPAPSIRGTPAAQAAAAAEGAPRRPPRHEHPGERSAAGRGRLVLLAAAVLAVAAVVVFVVGSGGSTTPPPGPIPASAATTTNASSTTAASNAQVRATIALQPVASGSSAKGEVAIVHSGSGDTAVFEAANLPTPKSGHYVLWLYDSASHAKPLGVVPPATSSTVGPLQVTLPPDASSYHGVALTLETSNAPTTAGPVVLRGTSSSAL
jgi:hypothetical protein